VGTIGNGGELRTSVLAGNSTVTESADPGFRVTSIACDDGDSSGNLGSRTVTFRTTPGETVTCTITNTRNPTVTVNKTTVGGDGTFSFGLSGQPARSVTTTGGSGATTFSNVATGNRTLTEDLNALGTTFDLLPNVACTANGAPLTTTNHTAGGKVDGVTFRVDPGAAIVCGFQNVKRGHLVVVKTTPPQDPNDKVRGQPKAHFSGVPGQPDWAVGLGGGQIDVAVMPSAHAPNAVAPYAVQETSSFPGWGLDVLSCTDPSGDTTSSLATATSTYRIDPGETVTCTYNNRPMRADLTLDVASPPLAIYGDRFAVQMNVNNSGPDTAPNTQASVTIDQRFKFEGALPEGCTSAPSGGATKVSCLLGTVAPNTSATRNLVVYASNCTITGTSGPDTLVGNASAETICGMGEGDTIDGGGGNDTIYGDVPPGLAAFIASFSGTASSTISEVNIANNSDSASTAIQVPVTFGVDTINGGTGADRVFGQGGDDIVSGDTPDLTIVTFGDGDALEGGDGRDSIFGQGGEDKIVGGSGEDLFLSGGSGSDTIFGDVDDKNNVSSGVADVINGGPDRDFLFGQGGKDRIEGDSGSDDIYGGDSQDFLFGSGDADNIWGGNGDDQLFGESGADHLYGDGGFDVVDGGPGDDTLEGAAGTDVMNGREGDDHLYGRQDEDWINGDVGADVIEGNQGRDVLNGGPGQDNIHGGDDRDWIAGEDGTDDLFGDDGNDNLNGGERDGTSRNTVNGGRNDTVSSPAGDCASNGLGRDNPVGIERFGVCTPVPPSVPEQPVERV
jgi:Ca2+-binding RTX toxin-like protein